MAASNSTSSKSLQFSKNYSLPTLPHGEGSMSYMPDGRIIYKKNIKGKRVSVYGSSPKEVMKKMKEKEKTAEVQLKQKERINTHSELLCDGLERWLKKYKKVELKKSSYDRLEDIIRNQINKYPIGHMEICAITQDDIQDLMNTLINENYSYSVIKKTYETLNGFFKNSYSNEPYKNIMLGTIKPTQKSVTKPVKEIEFFENDDIKKMVEVANKKYANGKYIYKLGWGIIGIMYTGMRASEALALKWDNIDLSKGEIQVLQTASIIKDRDESSDRKYQVIYNSPKTAAGKRTVLMSKNAVEAFESLKDIQNPKSDDEYVFATSNGTPMNLRNLRRLLNNMQVKAGTKIQDSGTHILRHTFCSLLVRNGIDKVVIARLLGQQGTDMIERIYQHVTTEEKMNAITSIDKFTELNVN